MNWQGLKTQTLLAFIWGKQLLMNVLTLLAWGWRSSVHLSNWQSPIWGQLKCTQLFGRGRITLARHAPAPCFHNRKSRCSWEIWQHTRGETKQTPKTYDAKTGKLSWFFLPWTKQQAILALSSSIKWWWWAPWQRAINALLKDGHCSLSVWYAKSIWFPICMYA